MNKKPEQPAPAQQCVCGEPETSGTHRTDGPCYAEQPAPAQEPEPDELTIAYMSGLHEGKKIGAKEEREACAKVCEEDGLLWGQRYAAAIRARGAA